MVYIRSKTQAKLHPFILPPLNEKGPFFAPKVQTFPLGIRSLAFDDYIARSRYVSQLTIPNKSDPS